MIAKLVQALRDFVPASRPPVLGLTLPDADPEDMQPAPAAQPVAVPARDALSGTQVEIEYVDSRGQGSVRRVVCLRLEGRAGLKYLHTRCLERRAPRVFRVDRIAALIDPATGEIHQPGSLWLAQFDADFVTDAPFRYGLSPTQYSDFNAGLAVLAFIARCDGRWHDLEGEAIEAFASAFWIRSELSVPFDETAIMRHAARLGPDAESLLDALPRCGANPVLRQIICRHVEAVVNADGHLHPKEVYWAAQIGEALAAPV